MSTVANVKQISDEELAKQYLDFVYSGKRGSSMYQHVEMEMRARNLIRGSRLDTELHRAAFVIHSPDVDVLIVSVRERIGVRVHVPKVHSERRLRRLLQKQASRSDGLSENLLQARRLRKQ